MLNSFSISHHDNNGYVVFESSKVVAYFLSSLKTFFRCFGIFYNHSRNYNGAGGKLHPSYKNLRKIRIFREAARKYLGKTNFLFIKTAEKSLGFRVKTFF